MSCLSIENLSDCYEIAISLISVNYVVFLSCSAAVRAVVLNNGACVLYLVLQCASDHHRDVVE